jgi:hypothetical protein
MNRFGTVALLILIPIGALGQAIPASFFGLHTAELNTPGSALQVSYGEYRNLASSQTWFFLNTCNPPQTPATCQANPAANSSFNFGTLDTLLANVKSAGVNDVLFTLSFTPTWAAAYTPPKGTCTIQPTGCILPPDINPDGSGTDAIWDNWVRNIASHANNATWLKTHAHIKYWEPWNEVFSDPTVNSCCTPASSLATFAQDLRFTEDTRCLILGVGTIHNYPSAGSSTSCSSYLTSQGYSAIDPNAEIVLSSQSPGPAGGVNIHFFQNYLYCNHSPQNDSGSTTTCTWGGGLNWMSNAVDIINFHMYVTHEQPEKDLPAGSTNNWVSAIKGVLSAADSAKPLWNGEGSCGPPPATNPQNIWGDNYSMAGFTIRHAALLWSAGVTRDFWFMYETSPTPYCPFYSSTGSLLPAGIAWSSGYRWLVGSTPANSPFCSASGTLWTCPLTEPNGRAAELVWDSQYGPGGTTSPSNCSTASTPTICGSTGYRVPAAYTGGDWLDVTGTVHPFSPTVTVGAVPILIEGTSGVNIKGNVKVTGQVQM